MFVCTALGIENHQQMDRRIEMDIVREVFDLITDREVWTTIHGIIFGAVYLLGFGAALVGLWAAKNEWTSAEKLGRWFAGLKAGLWAMAGATWLAVITGTWIIYPWYRAKPPEGANLVDYPRYFLLDDPAIAAWHSFGMEWKEHVAWLAPILLTGAVYVLGREGVHLARNKQTRQAVIVFMTLAFVAAAIAGLMGALITRAAPVK